MAVPAPSAASTGPLPKGSQTRRIRMTGRGRRPEIHRRQGRSGEQRRRRSRELRERPSRRGGPLRGRSGVRSPVGRLRRRESASACAGAASRRRSPWGMPACRWGETSRATWPYRTSHVRAIASSSARAAAARRSSSSTRGPTFPSTVRSFGVETFSCPVKSWTSTARASPSCSSIEHGRVPRGSVPRRAFAASGSPGGADPLGKRPAFAAGWGDGATRFAENEGQARGTRPLTCGDVWWRGGESNPRHTDFQSVALPTELPSRMRSRARVSIAQGPR